MQIGDGRARRCWPLAGIPLGWGVVRRTPLDGVLALFFGVCALSTLASGHPLEARRAGCGRCGCCRRTSRVFWWLRDRGSRAPARAAGGGWPARVAGRVRHPAALHRRRLVPRAPSAARRASGRASPGAEGFAVVGFFRNYLTYAHAMIFPLALGGARSRCAARSLGMVAAALLDAGGRVLDRARRVDRRRRRWRCCSLATLAGGRRGSLAGRRASRSRRSRWRCRPGCASRRRRSSRSAATNAGRIGHLPGQPRHHPRPSAARARLRPLQGAPRARTTTATPRPTGARTRTATSCRSPRRRAWSGWRRSASLFAVDPAARLRGGRGRPTTRAVGDRGRRLGRHRHLPPRRAHAVQLRRRRGGDRHVAGDGGPHALRGADA